MNGWWIILLLAVAVVCYPFLRFVAKRMVLYGKLKRACRRSGVHLAGTHFLWMLARRNRNGCDLTITHGETVICVKLFASYRRASSLVFTHDGNYYVKHYLALFAHYQTLVTPFDGRRRPVPQCDCPTLNDSAMPVKQVLLVHPICMELRHEDKAEPLADGDKINGVTVLSLSGLLRMITN